MFEKSLLGKHNSWDSFLQIEVLKSLSKPPAIIPFDSLDIDHYDLNQESNQTAHFTDAYEYPGLVVRRGKSFTITVTTTKPFPKGKVDPTSMQL